MPGGRRGVFREASVFAIIKSGGRQVKVTPGTIVEVDRVPLAAGDKVTIDEVLFVGKDDGAMLSGAPFVRGAKVLGVIAGESRGPKIRVFKKRRRKTMRVSRGHRSTLTKVEIKAIEI